MSVTFLELFRTLSSFDPRRASLKDAPWEEYVPWAIGHGVAPLAAYNLEYRLPGVGAPAWARERLLSVYQGSLNDNVLKLVNLKRTLDDLQGRKILLFGAASFAEALYPHVAFRPVIDIELWVKPHEVDAFANFLRGAEFQPSEEAGPPGVARVLSDERTTLYVYGDVLGPRRAAQQEALLERALPMKVYGTSMFRPDLEDAILLTALLQARDGFVVPAISLIDLRELLLGGASMGSVYSRPVDFDALVRRAKEWRIERALYAACGIVEALFPWAADAARSGKPKLRSATQALLDRLVVRPWSDLGQLTHLRGADRLRRLLTGGG